MTREDMRVASRRTHGTSTWIRFPLLATVTDERTLPSASSICATVVPSYSAPDADTMYVPRNLRSPTRFQLRSEISSKAV